MRKKPETILFRSKRKWSKVRSLDVTCNNHSIRLQNCMKYLGLDINNSLSGKSVINNIKQKINLRLKFIYKQSNCLSDQSRKSLFTESMQ